MHSTKSDNELRAHSLGMWANHIETGYVSVSSTDLQMMGRAKDIKKLEPEQVDLVRRLRDLAQAERSS